MQHKGCSSAVALLHALYNAREEHVVLIDALPVKGSWRTETEVVARLREAMLKHVKLSGWRKKKYAGFYFDLKACSYGPLEITYLYGQVTEFGNQDGHANDFCSYQAGIPVCTKCGFG